MKVIFHIGESVDADTVIQNGIMDDDTQLLYIEYKDNKYFLDDIRSVDLHKFNGLGTVVKLKNGNDTVFLSVPWIVIEKGSGFAIINRIKTKRLKQILELAMKYQKQKQR